MKTIINEIIPESFLWWSILLLSIAISYVGRLVMRRFYRIKRNPNFAYNIPLIRKVTDTAYIIVALAMIELALIYKLSSISPIPTLIMGIITINSWLMGYRKYIRNNN